MRRQLQVRLSEFALCRFQSFFRSITYCLQVITCQRSNRGGDDRDDQDNAENVNMFHQNTLA
ncbi:hypothetical protein F4Z98_10600 [Candidatus Poribacteria bacterium]|nr:hypothetical protein [Candidatus Poribacteria bacterium]